ncbi:DUF5819 family protein [Streptomyces netropsis]|uniref:Uncharacterized protein n=1 Tax=Streptomyces netropsis TaxID=55404 RepID=A0A7W7LDL7_STRNE|nr:hypothetical protein [Streptomyces netropsis]GGR34068.1 hypothetical protein GCM10010219_43740 [Streptomyces netropsis]
MGTVRVHSNGWRAESGRDMESDDGHERTVGIAGLSLPSRIAVAVGVAGVAVAVAVHVSMMFLHVAPSNTISKQHGSAIDDYVYPEFEQNWKFFAPNPLQQNVAVQARAELRGPDGRSQVTPWIDLSAQDGAALRHNLLPSHTQQNELRRAWDFYAGTHDGREQPNGMRGRLSEEYIRRIAVLRLGGERDGRPVQRVQVRAVTTAIAPPPWSDEKVDTRPVHRLLGWWPVTTADLPEAKNR